MSFLSRRRSTRQPRPSLSPSPSPSPQPSSHGSALDLAAASLGPPPPSVRKRFSTLAARLTLPMRPHPRPKALSNISRFAPRSPSRSPSPLSPDIRRPSGLGRRASSLSPDEESPTPKPASPAFALRIESPRERCASSPDLLARASGIPSERGRSMRIRRKPLPLLEPTSPPPTSPLPPPPPTPPTEDHMHDADAQMIANGFHFPPSPTPSTHGSHLPQSPSAETLPPISVAFPSSSSPASPEPRPKTAPAKPTHAPIPLPRPARARSRPFPVPLALLLPHLSRADLARIACVSRRFRAAATAALYRDLDLAPRAFAPSAPPTRWNVQTSTSSESHSEADVNDDNDDDDEDGYGHPTEPWQRAVDACITRLASTPALGALVHAFSCPLYPSPSGGPSPSFALALRLALANMPHLAALVLPAPPPDMPRPPFALRGLELTAPCAWRDVRAFVAEQHALEALAVPLLRDADLAAEDGLLPALTTLAGPPALVAALAPRRPVHSATLHVAQTLYDGLRPAPAAAALAHSAVPVTHVAIAAAPRVDARSLAKVAIALARELGGAVLHLDVRCALPDAVLYKQLTPLLPRFRALRTLRLVRTRGARAPADTQTQMQTRAPVLPAPAPLDSPDSPPLSALLGPDAATPAFVTPPSSPWLAVSFPAATLRSAELDVELDVDGLEGKEERDPAMLVAGWKRACAQLEEVVLPSGARWVGGGGSASALVRAA